MKPHGFGRDNMGKNNEDKMVRQGTYYVTSDGAGQIYVPIELSSVSPFKNKDKLKETLEDDKIIIEKME